MIIVNEVSHPHELRSSFIYHEFENLRIHIQMKRILKNDRRKRCETYTIEFGNDLSFHLKFLSIPSSNLKFYNSIIRDKNMGKFSHGKKILETLREEMSDV